MRAKGSREQRQRNRIARGVLKALGSLLFQLRMGGWVGPGGWCFRGFFFGFERGWRFQGEADPLRG